MNAMFIKWIRVRKCCYDIPIKTVMNSTSDASFPLEKHLKRTREGCTFMPKSNNLPTICYRGCISTVESSRTPSGDPLCLMMQCFETRTDTWFLLIFHLKEMKRGRCLYFGRTPFGKVFPTTATQRYIFSNPYRRPPASLQMGPSIC